jgi:hypothetical protein
MGIQSGTNIHFVQAFLKRVRLTEVLNNCLSCSMLNYFQQNPVSFQSKNPFPFMINSFINTSASHILGPVANVEYVYFHHLQTVDIEDALCSSNYGHSLTHSIISYDFNFLEVAEVNSFIFLSQPLFQFCDFHYFFLFTLLFEPRDNSHDGVSSDFSKHFIFSSVLAIKPLLGQLQFLSISSSLPGLNVNKLEFI